MRDAFPVTRPKFDSPLETARRSSLPDSRHRLTAALHDPPAGPKLFPGIESRGWTSALRGPQGSSNLIWVIALGPGSHRPACLAANGFAPERPAVRPELDELIRRSTR
jgi:hypothetical protein